MTIQSWGYPGVFAPGPIWAALNFGLGNEYWVNDPGSVKVSPLAGGTRQVSISPGYFGGSGVVDLNDAYATVDLPVVASGTNYFLIVARRTWGTTKATTFEYIDAGTTGNIILPPRNTDVGVLDDQPLAIVPLSAGSTDPGTPIDLRAVTRAKGVFLTASELTLQYLNQAGYTVWIGSTVWRRLMDTSGNLYWDTNYGPAKGVTLPVFSGVDVIVTEPGWTASSLINEATRDSNRVDLHVEMRKTSGVLVADDSSGNFPDTVICKLGSRWSPDRAIPIGGYYAGGPSFVSAACMLQVNPSSTAPTVSLLSGTPGLDIYPRSSGALSLRFDVTFLQRSPK